MAFEIRRITMLIHNKDDIEFVTEIPFFWDTLYLVLIPGHRQKTFKGNILYSGSLEITLTVLLNKKWKI